MSRARESEKELYWGKATWILFHSLAERIHPAFYTAHRYEIFNIITRICKNLPCPNCRKHASNFMSRVNIKSIVDKSQFRAMLYVFHNSVNKRIGKPRYPLKDLVKYKSTNMDIALSNFLTFYAKRYNGTIQAGVTSTEIARRGIAHWVLQWF